MLNTQPYPDVLPKIDPAWLTWNDGAVRKIAQEIHASKDWTRLGVLADCLEECGCTDDVILSHLREIDRKCDNCKGKGWWSCKEKFPTDTHPDDDRVFRCHSCETMHVDRYKNGCWLKECWLINHLLGYEQPLEAEYSWPGHSMADSRERCPVVDQGEWGRGTLVIVSYGPNFYVESESDEGTDLDDILVDDDKWGPIARISEEDLKDWGMRVSPGVIIGGVTIEQEGWMRLDGTFTTTEPDREEPGITGSGNYYDSQDITWHSVANVRYFGPGLPKEGVTPEVYHGRWECRDCGKLCFGERPDGPDLCCNCAVADIARSDD